MQVTFRSTWLFPIGGSGENGDHNSVDSDRAPMLSKEEQCLETPPLSPGSAEHAFAEQLTTTAPSCGRFENDSDVEDGRVGVRGDHDEEEDEEEEEEDIDVIVKEYKSKQIGRSSHGYSRYENEDQAPILPPRSARARTSGAIWRWQAELCLAGLIVCLVTLSALLEALSAEYVLQRPPLVSALVVASSMTALSALALLFVLSRQKRQQQRLHQSSRLLPAGILHHKLAKFGELKLCL